MEFRRIVETRRAVRSFDERIVPESLIAELKELIRLSATSFNLQPWRATVIDDRGTKDALAAAAWNQPQISTCSHLFVFCANLDLAPLIDRLEREMREAGNPEEQLSGYIGMIRSFIGNLSPAEQLSWAQRQTYLALANGINGAAALGLDACPMEGFQRQGIAGVLELPQSLVPTVLLPVGHANDEARPKLRFSSEHMFF